MSADPSSLPPLPKNHLSHPENWATGSEPITDRQAGFIGVLEKQHPEAVPEGGIDTAHISKSDASAIIESLKNGEKVGEQVNDPEHHVETGGTTAPAPEQAEGLEKEELSRSVKRKASADEEGNADGDMKKAANGDETAKTDEAEAKEANGEAGKVGSKKSNAKSEEADKGEDAAPPAKKARAESSQTNGEGQGSSADSGSHSNETAKGEVAEDPIEVDAETTPPADKIETPMEPESDKLPSMVSGAADSAASAARKGDIEADQAHTPDTEETIPGQEAHLDHPENWATGDEEATAKQKGYIKVLEKQKGVPAIDVDSLGKSAASETIDHLKHM